MFCLSRLFLPKEVALDWRYLYRLCEKERLRYLGLAWRPSSTFGLCDTLSLSLHLFFFLYNMHNCFWFTTLGQIINHLRGFNTQVSCATTIVLINYWWYFAVSIECQLLLCIVKTKPIDELSIKFEYHKLHILCLTLLVWFPHHTFI